MLQMLHQPLFEKENSTSQPDDKDGSVQENGSSSKEQPGFYLSLNEDLATRIAVEVLAFFLIQLKYLEVMWLIVFLWTRPSCK